MSKIVDFNKFKAAAELAKSSTIENDSDKNKSVFIMVISEMTEEWQDYATVDNLNQYILDVFRDKLIDRSLDYTGSLDSISKLEQHLRFNPMVLGPGATVGNSLGWGAGFYLNGNLYGTPEFSTEIHARCFNLILWVKLKEALRKKMKS